MGIDQMPGPKHNPATPESNEIWGRFFKRAVPGAVLYRDDPEFTKKDEGSSSSTTIVLGGEELNFPTVEDAQSAAQIALENGAILQWHHELGERWCRIARQEGWSLFQSTVALALLAGETKPSWMTERYSAQSTWDGKGTGRWHGRETSYPLFAGWPISSRARLEEVEAVALRLGIDFAESKKELVSMLRSINRY